MDPQTVFCPNLDCAARGHVDAGNIRVHSRTERRYRCDVCDKTFAESKGTVFYRLHKTKEVVTLVITLLAYGCPVPAIVVAFGLDERTVSDWHTRAGQHGTQVHEHLVQQPRDLGQVQADEVRGKMQGGLLWLAMAMQVSTRLWLGGVVSPQRDFQLIAALMQRVRAGVLCRPLLFCVDGFSAYVRAIRQGFREPITTGQAGRPHLRAWDNLQIAQVIKQYAHGHVVGILRRVVQGTSAQVAALITQTQGDGGINTAYIERLNATFRARMTNLIRKGRTLARQAATLQHGMYLIGTVYNFCTEHDSLRIPGIIGGHKWLPRTPAMAAGIADHRWTLHELLTFHVPPPRWTPPKQRGRPSNEMKRLIQQWAA